MKTPHLKTIAVSLLVFLSLSLRGQDYEQLILGNWQLYNTAFSFTCEGKSYDGLSPFRPYYMGGDIYSYDENERMTIVDAKKEIESSYTYKIKGNKLYLNPDDEDVEFVDEIRRLDSEELVLENSFGSEYLTENIIEEMIRIKIFTPASESFLRRFVGKKVIIGHVFYYRKINDLDHSNN